MVSRMTSVWPQQVGGTLACNIVYRGTARSLLNYMVAFIRTNSINKTRFHNFVDLLRRGGYDQLDEALPRAVWTPDPLRVN